MTDGKRLAERSDTPPPRSSPESLEQQEALQEATAQVQAFRAYFERLISGDHTESKAWKRVKDPSDIYAVSLVAKLFRETRRDAEQAVYYAEFIDPPIELGALGHHGQSNLPQAWDRLRLELRNDHNIEFVVQTTTFWAVEESRKLMTKTKLAFFKFEDPIVDAPVDIDSKSNRSALCFAVALGLIVLFIIAS